MKKIFSVFLFLQLSVVLNSVRIRNEIIVTKCVEGKIENERNFTVNCRGQICLGEGEHGRAYYISCRRKRRLLCSG